MANCISISSTENKQKSSCIDVSSNVGNCIEIKTVLWYLDTEVHMDGIMEGTVNCTTKSYYIKNIQSRFNYVVDHNYGDVTYMGGGLFWYSIPRRDIPEEEFFIRFKATYFGNETEWTNFNIEKLPVTPTPIFGTPYHNEENSLQTEYVVPILNYDISTSLYDDPTVYPDDGSWAQYNNNGDVFLIVKNGDSVSKTYTISLRGFNNCSSESDIATVDVKVGGIWTIISHQDAGTCSWRVTVENNMTGEIKSGVYPFNLEGTVYELSDMPGTWVIASEDGYNILNSWEGKEDYECFMLLGTGETINHGISTIRWLISGEISTEKFTPEDFDIGYWDDIDPGAYPGMTYLKFSDSFNAKWLYPPVEEDLSNETIASYEYRVSEIAMQGSTPILNVSWVSAQHITATVHYGVNAISLPNTILVSEDNVYADINENIYGSSLPFTNATGYRNINNNFFKLGASTYPGFSYYDDPILDSTINVTSGEYTPPEGYTIISSEQKQGKILLGHTKYHGNFINGNGELIYSHKSVHFATVKYIEYQIVSKY